MYYVDTIKISYNFLGQIRSMSPYYPNCVDLCGIEPRSVFRKVVSVDEMELQVAT